MNAIKSLFDAGGAQLFDDGFWGLEWWWWWSLLPLNKEELVNCEIQILYIHMHICIIIDNKMYEYVYSSITCLKEMARNNFHI